MNKLTLSGITGLLAAIILGVLATVDFSTLDQQQLVDSLTAMENACLANTGAYCQAGTSKHDIKLLQYKMPDGSVGYTIKQCRMNAGVMEIKSTCYGNDCSWRTQDWTVMPQDVWSLTGQPYVCAL